MGMITLTCMGCGRIFQSYNPSRRYHNRSCYIKGLSQRMQTGLIPKPPVRISKKKIVCHCLECGRAVTKFNSQAVIFCTPRCSADWSRKHRRGKNAGGYVDGRTPFKRLLRASAEYTDWRSRVFERDDWRCQICGRHGVLNVHHLIPIRTLISAFKQANPTLDFNDKERAFSLALKFPPFWDIANGKTLCSDCHLEEHPEVNLFGTDTRQFDFGF